MNKTLRCAALAAALGFAAAAVAGPAPPTGKLLITTYWFEGEAVGGDVDGVCPEGSPMPLPFSAMATMPNISPAA